MPKRPDSPSIREVRTPEAVAALKTWLSTLDDAACDRGTEYFRDGRVIAAWAGADHFFEAEVEGSDIYVVSLFLTRGKWKSQCTCPVGSDCKHVVAAGLAWISREGQDFDLEDEEAIALGEIWSPPTAPVAVPHGGPAPKKKRSFREEWTPKLAEKLGRPLTDAEGRQLGQLSAVFTRLSQSYGHLRVGDLQHSGFEAAIPPGADPWLPLFRDWWDPFRPPADPWELWQFLAYAIERNGGTIPEVLRPMSNTTAVQARVGQQLLRQELELWRRALEPVPSFVRPPRTNPIAAITGLRLRLNLRGAFFVEQRGDSTKGWKRLAQRTLRGFGDAFSTEFEHLPPAERTVALSLAAEARANPHGFGDTLDPEVAGRLLASPETHALLVQSSGLPLAVSVAALVREAMPSATARDRLELRLVTPEGRDASVSTPIAAAPSAYYLFEDRLWPGPPHVPARTLPVAALADPQLALRLRSSGLRLPASLEPKIQSVTLRPLLRAGLTEPSDSYGQEYVQVELLARSKELPCEQTWRGDGGWRFTKTGAPPPRGPDDPILELDLAAANAVGARFAEFRLMWHAWQNTWARPVTASFPDEFAAWHASLPAGLDIELSPGLAGLLDPPLRGKVDFSAIPTEGSGQDWFDLTVALHVEDTTLKPDELELLLKARGKWVRLKSGWKRLELALVDAGGNDAMATLDQLGLDAADVLATGKSATHRLHALQLAGEAAALESRDAKLAAALRERTASLARIPPPPLPAELTATLRPYQVEGFHFLAHLAAQGFGGVLADDMGLGKTVQTLAWILHLRAAAAAEKALGFRVLVVCPKSVTHGWLSETARFAPSLSIAAFAPGLVRADLTTLKPHLLVANYTQLRLHAGWFQSGSWAAVILDEGQFIKNPTSQVAVAVRGLAARHRIILTGTPVENRLTDLWSLFAFAQPGLLGTQTAFKRQHPVTDPSALARLHRRTRHFLLRRTKAQAAPDLPSRTEDELVVELEPAQRKLYDAELKRARAQLLGIETARALDKVRFNILASLLRLRQICCHPALVDPAHATLPSAKLDALLERLDELREEGHQVLVFSQFVEMLELIRERLVTADIGHLMLTGATQNRARLVETFQADRTKTVFLLSLKAAGFGLNLTAASYAILYDPWWNPAVEAQAIDRIHRIGQTKPVIAYRLLAADTVEQKIRALQGEKAALAAAVVQEESLAKVLDLDTLRQVLG